MEEQQESIGRIEVAPEVLITIVRQEVLGIKGVRKMAPFPAEVGHLFRRSSRHDGVILDYTDNRLAFDIYVYMEPDVNLRETSRAIQVAVVEAIDKMVGVPVDAVNVHVEDVVYAQGQTA
ncbi:MAG: Asp23/Gls24 family envelope stress response protein [Candidatus Promineifilaceae bacterium]|nr:Asp23/Gls24 family envelope stress response protein [Candidatus Promineifilaceae bacterium]